MFAHTRRSAGLLALASLLFAPVAHAVPEPDDLAGPPSFSINGCPANVEWTQPFLAEHFGFPERAVRRARTKYGASPTALCTLPYPQSRAILGKAAQRKPGFDQPDQALQYRLLSLRSDDGTIAEDGARKAFEQRREIVMATRRKLGGLTPGGPFWTDIGPGTVGGRIRAILPLSPTRIVVGSVSGGIWLTENGGTSWAPVRDLMPNVAITCLVPDPGDATILYACTGESYSGDGIRGDGIFRVSGVNGAANTWSISQVSGTASGSQWQYVNRLIVLPNGLDPGNVDNRLFIAATNQGLYRSTTGGASFVQVRTGRHTDIRYHPLDWGNIVAGNDAGGVSYSLDGGATWNTVATTGLPVDGGMRVEVTPVSGLANTWLASVDKTAGQLWRSTDKGITWTRRDAAGLDNVTGAGGVLDQQGWYDNTVWASPDGTRVLVGGVGIRLSVDGGVTFGINGAPPAGYVYGGGLPGIHVDHHAIVPGTDFATTGTVFFGNDGGLYKAVNLHTVASPDPGAIMTNMNNGLGITQFYGGAAAGTGGTFRLAGGTQDNGTRTFDGSNWMFTFGGDGSEGAVDPTNTQFVYGSIQNLGLFRSTNGGASASYICTGITDADCNGVGNNKTNFVPNFILDPNNSDRMLVGAESLWRSNNVRTSAPGLPAWAAIKGPTTSRFCLQNPANPFCVTSPNTLINFIAVAPGNSNIIWVGYNDGQLYTTTNGTDATPTWTANTYPGFAGAPTGFGRQVMRITFDPSNLQRAWVSFGGYNTGNVAMTANGGATWAGVHGNLPAAPVRALAVHPSVANVIYAGTEVGVFASETSGTTWSAQNEGPGTVSVEELFFTDAATLYATTHGRGAFRATINLATAPGTIQLSGATASVQEGAAVQLQANRVGGSFGAASVNYATASGSATSGTDFTASSGTLNWADGDATAKTITVQTAADAAVEGVEAFTVTLSGAAGATLGTPTVATVSLSDPEMFPLAGVLPPGAWSQPNTTPGGAADASIVKGWIVDTNPANAHEGTMSLRSDAIPSQAGGRKAVMELRTYTGAGNFSFARKVGSEPEWDCLRFYIDGVVQGVGGTCTGGGGTGASGNAAYSVLNFPVTAGMHTFRWSYEKDEIVEVAPDAALIDSITLPATGLDPAADSDGDSVPNGVELNEAINPTVKDNDVFAATPKGARLFAMQQYRDFLSREGEAAGIQAWTDLMTGGTTRDAVINAFFNSPEFNGFVAPVVRLYYATFLRVPDYAGLTFNAGLVRNGTVSLLQLADFFTASPEFAATYGALDDTAFVTLLYNNVLGRAPDPAGLSGWVGLLVGGMSRGQVLLGFSDSVEYQAAKFNEVYVTMMYVGMLRRSPEPAGYSGWLAYLQQPGNTPLAMINGFYLSTEYRGRFLP